MTVKDAAIALCFPGSIVLAVLGGWNYMKSRILIHEEKMKIEELLITRQPFLTAEEKLKQIREEKTNALIMLGAGVTGFFLVVASTNRRKRNLLIQQNKTIQP